MGKLNIKKGDTVEVVSGKDRGKRGKIIRSLPDKSRVVVEGLNMVKKHSRPTQRNPQSGGIVHMEAPIDASNVMLVCASCGKASRVGNLRDEDGKRVRTCRKCGAKIDKKA